MFAIANMIRVIIKLFGAAIMVIITLREVRKSKKLSIRQLSKLAQVSCGHISEVETGKKMPTIDVLVRIALSLKVKPEELYKIHKL